MRICLILAALPLFAAAYEAASAEQATVAVASNFARTARELAADFESATGHETRIVAASSGKLYAQIVNGAPFDLFLSADAARPAMLENEGLIVAGTRRSYALGRLVLWSREAEAGGDCLSMLERADHVTVAIANPDFAPYGLAARQFLERRGLWDRLRGRLVFGENVMQAYLFAARGGATFALTAASVVSVDPLAGATCDEPVPPGSHAPIEQQLVQLERSFDNAAAGAFAEYLAGDRARRLIARAGYGLPAAE